MKKFDSVCTCLNRTQWIKEKVQDEFGINLKEPSDLLLLDNLVKDAYYLDKTDWLREKMRQEIKKGFT